MGDLLRTMVVDDHSIMQDAIVKHLTSTGLFDVVGTASSIKQGTERLHALHPDFLVLDHELGDGTGLQLLHEARKLTPTPIVVILTAHSDSVRVARYLADGADGYASKTSPLSELVRVLTRAAQRLPAIDRVAAEAAADYVRNESARTNNTRLSQREKHALRLVALGWSNKQIAADMSVSEQTVKTFLARSYRKLGVHSRAEATSKVLREDLIGEVTATL